MERVQIGRAVPARSPKPSVAAIRTLRSVTPQERDAVARFADWDEPDFGMADGFGPAEAADIIYGTTFGAAPLDEVETVAAGLALKDASPNRTYVPVTPEDHRAVAAFEDAGEDGFGAAGQDEGPGVVEDSVKSLASGLQKGLVEIPGTVGDLRELGEWATGLEVPDSPAEMRGQIAEAIEERTGIDLPDMPWWMEKFVDARLAPGFNTLRYVPSSGQIQGFLEDQGMPVYEPQTRAGRFAHRIGLYLPGVVSARGKARVAQDAFRHGVVPAVTSEAAIQAGEALGVPESVLPWLGFAAGAASTGRGRQGPGHGPAEPGPTLGIFAGTKARTADHDALTRAKAMQKQGGSREEIWRETGWFQSDADGKWRFEIDDSGASFRDFDKLKDNPTKAGEAFDHEELYRAYPELRDEVTFSTDELADGVHGTHDPKGRTITVNRVEPGTRSAQANRKDPRATALHELQHEVQDKEKFSPGGSEALARDNQDRSRRVLNAIDRRLAEIRGEISVQHRLGNRDEVAKLRAEQQRLREKRLPVEYEAFASPKEIYSDFPGEREARTVESRRNYTPKKRKTIPPWESERVMLEEENVRRR